jgi:7-carboxy-7-deazaguanine synthase
MLDICERFVTLSGEAPVPGKPVYLYRFSGCNLNCSWCDTPYHGEVNCSIQVEDVVDDIKKKIDWYPGLSVLFSGGEPLMDNRIFELTRVMRQLPNVSFFIETNGSIDIRPGRLPNASYIIDVKAPSSGQEGSYLEINTSAMRPGMDCVKFVCNSDDFDWLSEKVRAIKRKNPGIACYASPLAHELEPAELAGFILDNQLDISLSLQIHRIIWPDHDRGV